MFDVMQGDAYSIFFESRGGNGIPINPSGVEDVEIEVGGITKKYSAEELHFADGRWIYPLSEAETKGFYGEDITVTVKIKTNNGEIVGCPVGEITLHFD